ncbi:MAG TPA: nucleoid-associated protein [Chitinophagaceae bacterium]|nr:nucleoid-associated protein [Chitinophagaceae bacterium]
MIQFSNASIEHSIIHFVGNKHAEVNSYFSQAEIVMEAGMDEHLKSFFFPPFKNNFSAFRFSHSIDLAMNEIFVCAGKILEGDDFVAQSTNIIQHLYNQINHPSVKPGEVFVVLFNNVQHDNIFCKAVGIFKSESNSNYVKLFEEKGSIGAYVDAGKHSRNVEKAALILNKEAAEGYSVFTFEKNNTDTHYWRNEFLQIIPKEDNYFHTSNLLNSFKEFVLTDLPEQGEISKSEQIHLINKSLDFVNENRSDFSTQKFVEQTLDGEMTRQQFYQFKEQYEQENNVQISDRFEISDEAIKKQLKQFKSVIKLDKNFHIYIHGQRDLIEQGVDNNGRKFYKIYFEQEF